MDDPNTPQQADGGHIPLFSLAPENTAAPYAAPIDNGQAVMEKHHAFGYDVHLTGAAATRAGVFGSYYDDSNDNDYGNYDGRSRRSRPRIGGVAITVGLLVIAAAILLTQPSARTALGSVTAHFFGGAGAPAANNTAPPAPSSSDVLALGAGSTQITPPVTAGADTPAATSAPTPTAPPAPSAAAPLDLTGSYAVVGGVATSHCQLGKATGATCTWHVTVQSGHQLASTVQWGDNVAVTVQLKDAAGNVLAEDSESGGTVSLALDTPPSDVYVNVTVTSGTSANYSVELSDQSP